MFIQKHGLLYDHETHRTIYLNNEDDTCCYLLEYDTSIYRAYEARKFSRLPIAKFTLVELGNMWSVFKYFRSRVKSLRFSNGTIEYLPEPLLNAMRTGELPEEISFENKDYDETNTYVFDEADSIIVKYMHDKIDSIYSIDLDKLEEFSYFKPVWNNLIKVPLLLYALKGYYKLFIKKQSIN